MAIKTPFSEICHERKIAFIEFKNGLTIVTSGKLVLEKDSVSLIIAIFGIRG